MDAVTLAIAIAACIVVQMFFAASEIALVSADELKVRASSERGEKHARLLDRMLADRDRLLALTLTGNNLATIIAAVMLTSALYSIGPAWSYLAPFILAPATLVIGEAVPKLLALRNPLGFARFAGPTLRFLAMISAPLLAAETTLSRGLRRLAGVPAEAQSVFLSREDLVMLLHRRGSTLAHDAILPVEREMISRIFRFSRAEARKAMVPLVQVDALPADSTLDAAIAALRRDGHSRIPVFQRRITDITGVIHVFDLLEAPDLTRPVTEVMRPVSYFPESMPLDEALFTFQRTGENLAVVVDEYGGASGILTLEDLLEQIVGDIADEHDSPQQLARVINPQSLAVAGRAPIAELNERYRLNLPEGDEYATIGGLVVERLGHIPKPGEQIQAGDVTITVVRSDARAVREVSVGLAQPLASEPAGHR
ncbi:MAG: hemolysin family protein [Candidatus Binataceae bacterium]